MEQHLITAAESLFRNFRRERQMRNHGNRERERKREQTVGSGAVVSKIIKNDREPRLRAALCCGRAGGQCRDHMNCVRARSMERIVEAEHAAGRSLNDIEFVAASDLIERARESAGLRWISKADVNIVARRLARGARR